jgi:hypothetical protein
MLDAYEVGDSRAVGAEWAAVTNYQRFSLELPDQGGKWIRSAPEGTVRDRRRRLAALFALELAHATLDTPPAWIRIRDIVEWGCEQVRSGQATAFERTWLLAADSVMQASGDTGPLLSRHARHSQQRFPDDLRFRLAEAVAGHETKLAAHRPGAPIRLLVYGYGTLSPRRDLSRVRVRETLDRLTALADDPAVGPEARLHLGVLHFHLEHLAESLAQLQAAARASADPFVTYLAHLISGHVLEFQQEPAKAVSAYRSALAVRPDAASGLSALGALLFLADHRDEAADLYARMVTRYPPAPDPWREFALGSYRFWSTYIDQLRREVRR